MIKVNFAKNEKVLDQIGYKNFFWGERWVYISWVLQFVWTIMWNVIYNSVLLHVCLDEEWNAFAKLYTWFHRVWTRVAVVWLCLPLLLSRWRLKETVLWLLRMFRLNSPNTVSTKVYHPCNQTKLISLKIKKPSTTVSPVMHSICTFKYFSSVSFVCTSLSNQSFHFDFKFFQSC